MSLRAERYRTRAAECDQAAQELREPATKALYLDLARQWRNLARQATALDREREEE
jgi:hypothetical protein